jgi:Fur family transcriptional regulator, ferric uptake regulator
MSRRSRFMTTSTLDRQVEARLRERDIRYTKGRRIVVAALNEADGPRSAADLASSLGATVPLSSIYRTLAVLEDADVVTPHFATKGIARYELAEWLTGHHHHLVCVDCGAVEDVEVPVDSEAMVRSVVADISTLARFTPMNHALEIEGRCKDCA